MQTQFTRRQFLPDHSMPRPNIVYALKFVTIYCGVRLNWRLIIRLSRSYGPRFQKFWSWFFFFLRRVSHTCFALVWDVGFIFTKTFPSKQCHRRNVSYVKIHTFLLFANNNDAMIIFNIAAILTYHHSSSFPCTVYAPTDRSVFVMPTVAPLCEFVLFFCFLPGYKDTCLNVTNTVLLDG